MTRLNLYNRNQPCGARAIRDELATYHVRPLPSLTMISRTLKELGLTYRRTELY